MLYIYYSHRKEAHLTKQSRRPGAPSGNTNALKHGFYSPRFKANDLNDLRHSLQTHSLESMEDEVVLLKVLMRSVLNKFGDTHTYDEALKLLRTADSVGNTIHRLSRKPRQ